MSELTTECPDCAGEIEPAAVLEGIATRETNSATALVENADDVDVRCPDCGREVSLPAAEVIVRLSVHNPILKVLDTMRENESEYRTAGWSEGIKDALEREQESFRRKQELRRAADELREDLDE